MEERRAGLHTLSFGQLIKRTCKTTAKNYGTFFVSHLIASVIVFLIAGAMIPLAVPQLIRAISTGDIDFGMGFIWIITAGSLILTLISVFFTEQFSIGLVFAAVKHYENGGRLSLCGAYSLAKAGYKNVTLTLLAIMLCSLGIGVAAIPLGLVAIIPVIGILAVIGVSYAIEILFSFSVCAAAADKKTAFGAIKFGATVTFYGGFFKTLLHMFLASVIMGVVIAALSWIAVPALINGKVLDTAFMKSIFNSSAWYIALTALCLLASAVSVFFNVFMYYLYANARIRAANKAYDKMIQAQNVKESWEAYKEDEAKKRWEELSEGCHTFREDIGN